MTGPNPGVVVFIDELVVSGFGPADREGLTRALASRVGDALPVEAGPALPSVVARVADAVAGPPAGRRGPS